MEEVQLELFLFQQRADVLIVVEGLEKVLFFGGVIVVVVVVGLKHHWSIKI